MRANEPGSSFECALDSAAFASCPSAGISYEGLTSGSHSFQVRAMDPSGNVDLTPAGYSFTIVIASTPIVLGPASSAPAPPAPSPKSPAAPPTTRITLKPAAKTHDRTPTFHFGSNRSGASFQCKLDGGAFTENPTSTQPPDRYGNRRSECRITSVTSMTDDEILELYVDHGVTPPPPPMGSGKIEVGEQKEETTGGAAPAGDTPAAKTEADEGASAQPDSTAASN